jgi:DNA primase
MISQDTYKVTNIYTNEEIIYIVYNNRSLSNVVYNFIPKFNIKELLTLKKIEQDFKYYRSLFMDEQEMGLEINNIDKNALDIKVTIEDIKDRTDLILNAHKNLSGDELKYLKDRGFTDEIIKKGKLGSMSYVENQKDLDILGISTHPIMNKMFDGGTKGGGIIIPLFDQNGYLINASFRKLSDYNKLKYTHTCPDMFVWGLNEIEKGDIIWLVEGVFDKYVLETVIPESSKVIATSSASISPIQYLKIINKKPSKINIICDNDKVGFKMGAIAQKIFHLNRIICSTFYFDENKDVTEHILNGGEIFDLIKIDITKEFISEMKTEYEDRIPLNFFDYLKNRKF